MFYNTKLNLGGFIGAAIGAALMSQVTYPEDENPRSFVRGLIFGVLAGGFVGTWLWGLIVPSARTIGPNPGIPSDPVAQANRERDLSCRR